MADEVVVKFSDIENAIFDGVNSNRELRRLMNRFIDDVEETWHHVWDTAIEGIQDGPGPPPHTYETGDYGSRIKKKKLTLRQRLFIKSAIKKGILIGSVYNDSDHAHFLEYGTGPDKPGGHSPWGPNTPTPEFAPMRKTWAIMEGEGEVR